MTITTTPPPADPLIRPSSEPNAHPTPAAGAASWTKMIATVPAQAGLL